MGQEAAPDNTEANGQGCVQVKLLFANIASRRNSQLGKPHGGFSKKLTEAPHGPAIPLLHLYPKRLNQGLEELCVLPCFLQHSSQ